MKKLIPAGIKRLIKSTPAYRLYSQFKNSPERLRKDFIAKAFPRVIGVNLNVSKCVLRCRMCPQYSIAPERSQAQVMPLELYQKVVDQIPDKEEISFEIASYGETLLSKNWEKMVRYAVKTKPRMSTVLVTNGVVLNDEAAEMILSEPPAILQVSIDAATPESYKWLCGGDLFDKSARNLRNFMARRSEKGLTHPIVQTHIIELEEFRNEIDTFKKSWANVVDHVDARHLGNWGGLIDENGVTPMWTPPPVRYPCAWPFFATKVMPNGDVHKCHVHFLSGASGVGNVLEKPIAEIWEDAPLKKVRQRQLDGEFSAEPMCLKCNVWALFPNIWKKSEYRPASWTGKSWLGKPYLYGKEGRKPAL
jgi:radical SAM protein with 4Fe4S-binding SPASM domain